jgi:hypothetical protein
MTRMVVGFDPGQAQVAISELQSGLGPGIEWRVLTVHQNPNGVQPMRPTPDEESGAEPHDESPNLLQRLAGLFGKDDEGESGPRVGSPEPPRSDSPLDLTAEELEYLRRAPARAASVILLTAPDTEEEALRAWAIRHGGFSLSPIATPDTETGIKGS